MKSCVTESLTKPIDYSNVCARRARFVCCAPLLALDAAMRSGGGGKSSFDDPQLQCIHNYCIRFIRVTCNSVVHRHDERTPAHVLHSIINGSNYAIRRVARSIVKLRDARRQDHIKWHTRRERPGRGVFSRALVGSSIKINAHQLCCRQCVSQRFYSPVHHAHT